MPIGTDGDGTDDNEGPHCRNCHTGGSNCNTCHSDDVGKPNAAALGYPNPLAVNVSAAYTATTTAQVKNMTNYAAQSYIRQNAATSTVVGAPCLDAGFSFPHRTLGKDMLKDELYGIDFNGTAVAAGDPRTTNGGALNAGDGAGTDWEYWIAEDRNSTSIIPSVRSDVGSLEETATENMDSVCIDCHGDATYYGGNSTALKITAVPTWATSTVDAYGYGGQEGWELLLKGLP